MRLIDADTIPYTMLYKENRANGTGREEQGVWKSDIDKLPTIEPKPCASCPHNPVEAMVRNGGEDVCPDAFKPMAIYCNYNYQKREEEE